MSSVQLLLTTTKTLIRTRATTTLAGYSKPSANYSTKTYTGKLYLSLNYRYSFIVTCIKNNYSDLKVVLKDGRELNAHKFVLVSRSNNWDNHNLSVISELDLSGKQFKIDNI